MSWHLIWVIVPGVIHLFPEIIHACNDPVTGCYRGDPVTGCHTHSLEVCIRLCAHFIYYACVEENDKCLAAFYLVFGICISCFQMVTLALYVINERVIPHLR